MIDTISPLLACDSSPSSCEFGRRGMIVTTTWDSRKPLSQDNRQHCGNNLCVLWQRRVQTIQGGSVPRRRLPCRQHQDGGPTSNPPRQSHKVTKSRPEGDIVIRGDGKLWPRSQSAVPRWVQSTADREDNCATSWSGSISKSNLPTQRNHCD